MTFEINVAAESGNTPVFVTGGAVSVNMDISPETFRRAEQFIRKRVTAENYDTYTDWYANGRTYDELVLQFAAFCAISDKLGCKGIDLIKWISESGHDCAVEDYSIWRVRQMDDEEIANILFDKDIQAIGERVIESQEAYAKWEAEKDAREAKRRAQRRSRKATN